MGAKSLRSVEFKALEANKAKLTVREYDARRRRQ